MVEVKGLSIPYSAQAVRWYRFNNPGRRMGFSEMDLYSHDIGEDPEDWYGRTVKFMAENGLEWDVVWTSFYGDKMQAILGGLKEHGAEVVVDVDDLFEKIPLSNIVASYWNGERRKLYKELIRSADRVVASTPRLAAEYGGLYAPNFIEPMQWGWSERPTKDLDEVVILCSGGTGRAGDFMMAERGLKAALELPNTKMVFMGAFPEWALDFPAGKAIWCRWVDLKDYPRMLKWISPDIVVSPMEHIDFNTAKSNLKWLEAGAVGATFVGENWGEYARTVVDQETGVLCDGDWAERLRWICTDHDERRKIAEQGRAEMLKNWTWEAVGKDWRAAVLGESTHANDHGSTGH